MGKRQIKKRNLLCGDIAIKSRGSSCPPLYLSNVYEGRGNRNPTPLPIAVYLGSQEIRQGHP